MLMLESDGDVLELLCQKYRGIRPVLKRWQGDGFDLLLLKFGDAVVSGGPELPVMPAVLIESSSIK